MSCSLKRKRLDMTELLRNHLDTASGWSSVPIMHAATVAGGVFAHIFTFVAMVIASLPAFSKKTPEWYAP